jgi:hypothetical protein
MKMNDTCTVTNAKRRKVQYDREYMKRVRNEIDNSGLREEHLARAAVYNKRCREKKKKKKEEKMKLRPNDAIAITKEDCEQDAGTNKQVMCMIPNTNADLISLGENFIYYDTPLYV